MSGLVREKNDPGNVPVMPVQPWVPNIDSDLQLAKTAMSPRIFRGTIRERTGPRKERSERNLPVMLVFEPQNFSIFGQC